MATQIKITIEIRDYNENIVNTYYEYIEDVQSKEDTILFNFNESDNIYIQFDYNYQIRSIKYEDYDSGELNEIPKGEMFQLSTGREEYGSYFCGYFSIEINLEDKIYKSLFFVEPKNLEYQNVLYLREYVNRFYHGLSLDLMKKRKTTTNSKERKSYQSNIYDKYMFLTKYYPNLMSYINQVINYKPAEVMKKPYVSHTPKKMDAKSIQWLMTKGMGKNDYVYLPETMLVRKTTFEIDNLMNQFFKQQLLFWNKEVASIITGFQFFVDELDCVITQQENEVKQLSMKINDLSQYKNISTNLLNSEKHKYSRMKEELLENRRLYQSYKEELSKIVYLKIRIEYALYNTWVKRVSVLRTNIHNPKDSRLRLLESMKKEYLGLVESKKDVHNGVSIAFSQKCTPKLFETYIYVLLLDILTSNGFDFSNDFDIDMKNILYLLSNQSQITLKKDEYYCDILYDNELKKSNGTFNESAYCYINSMHNRPDFILSFYKDKNVPLVSIVIEVKWRPLRNIYNPVGDTNVVFHLKDYFTLGFHNHVTRKTMRGVISKVITLYPDCNEQVIHIQENEILALGIHPTEKIKQSIGLNHLLDEINRALAENDINLILDVETINQ